MATIQDIAKAAGVSTATVSHVVNHTRYVSPELVARVEEAIQKCGEPPKFVKRKREKEKKRMREGGRNIYALISDITNPMYIAVSEKLRQIFEAKGYPVIILDMAGISKAETYEKILGDEGEVAGLFLCLDECEEKFLRMLATLDMPMVVIGDGAETLRCDRVSSDYFGGVYNGVMHLIRNGHERIAFLCRGLGARANRQRLEGYRKALEDGHIRQVPEYQITNIREDRDIDRELQKILWSEEAPTAVVAANYKSMPPLLKFLECHNLECPKDISVVGFNDYMWASLVSPKLTVIAQNRSKLAEAAAAVLERRIRERAEGSEEESEYQEIMIPTELRVRESTRGIGRGPLGEPAADMEVLRLTEPEIRKCRTRGYTAAISFHYTGKGFMRLTEQGIRNVFDKMNISLIAIVDAHFDPELQKKQLESLMMMKPDILIALPTDVKKMSESFRRIAETRTKLVFISNVPEQMDHSSYVSCVSVNERSHGRVAGTGLGEYMMRAGRKNVGMICHKADFYATAQRDMAAEQVLREEFPELTVCARSGFLNIEEVYEETVKLMKRHPEIEGLYISWEGPAQEAMRALADIGRQDVAISTADLDYDVAMSMARNGMIKEVSAQLPYEQGEAVALCAANALLEKEVPPYIGIEPVAVNLENLLKAWNQVYKETPPEIIVDLVKEISGED